MPASKTALLVIDVQRGILAIPNLVRKKEIDQALDETVARIAGLIQRARTASVPVIYVQHDGGPGHRLEPETSGWPIQHEIAPQPGEPVIHKRACAAFFLPTVTQRRTQARSASSRSLRTTTRSWTASMLASTKCASVQLLRFG